MNLSSLCQLFGYTRQAFYKQQQKQMKTHFTEERIVEVVRDEREALPRLGTRKLHHLLHQRKIFIGRDKLYRLLRDHDLLVRPRKRYVARTTFASHRAHRYKNLIEGLEITRPNQVWVADITYIRLKEGFAYLSLLTDAYSRKIVGHALHPNLETDGCINALNQAIGTLCWSQLRGIIHHSDRGSQYCSKQYVKLLKNAAMNISVTQNGDPYENAIAERINGILKTEWIDQERYDDFTQAKERIDQIILLYNVRRPHTALKYKTPEQVHGVSATKRKKATSLDEESLFRNNFVNQ